MFAFRKPRLASHYYVRTEPPDDRGDEVLHFQSGTRRITLKGHSFREFERYVVPMLDGTQTVAAIASSVADVFEPEDVIAGLTLLADQRLLEEGDIDAGELGRIRAAEPQHNLMLDAGADPRAVRDRLRRATIAVFGLAGSGAAAALSLAGSGVGTLRLIDDAAITAADPYLASAYGAADIGQPRTAALAARIAALGMDTKTLASSGPFDSDDAIAAAIGANEFVICALDPGQSALIYRLNRVCLRTGTRWLAVSSAAFEISVGPLVSPYDTACYLCYRMRAVACAEEPEQEFAFQSFLDRRKRDDSGTRENLVFGTATAGQLAALEAFKAISGVANPATLGRVIVFDLATLAATPHVVLRKPWCPACHGGRDARPASV